MKNSKHKKKKSVGFSFVDENELAEEIAEIKQSGLDVKENYENYKNTADWKIKEYLTKSDQIIIFLDEELNKQLAEGKKKDQTAQEKQAEVIRLEAENTTLKEKDGQRNYELNEKKSQLQEIWSNFNSFMSDEENSSNLNHPPIFEQIEDLKKNILGVIPNKGFQSNILNFFGILGGIIVIIGVFWEWWQKREIKKQLGELELKLKKNLKWD